MINLLQYKNNLKVKSEDGVPYLYDAIRKKYMVLQPEEMVRQLTICFLVESIGFNQQRLQVEKQVIINGRSKRYDIVVYDEDLLPYLLVECKAPSVHINQSTFDQLAIYNFSLKAPFSMVTNGINSYFYYVDHIEHSYKMIATIPLP